MQDIFSMKHVAKSTLQYVCKSLSFIRGVIQGEAQCKLPWSDTWKWTDMDFH